MEAIYYPCRYCGNQVPPDAYFCPACGKQLREKELSTSVAKQILIYAVSFFLPPLGLMWTFKYLKQESQKAKNIGIISLVLTVVAIAVAVWVTADIVNGLNSYLNNQLNGSLQLY